MAASDLRAWAVKGAEQRLVEIVEETRVIFQTFPELRHRGRGFDPAKASATSGANMEWPANATNRRRRKMSAAVRKAVRCTRGKELQPRTGRHVPGREGPDLDEGSHSRRQAEIRPAEQEFRIFVFNDTVIFGYLIDHGTPKLFTNSAV